MTAFQEAFARALANPFLTTILMLVLSSLPYTGRLSVNMQRVLMVAAFVVAIVALWRFPLPVRLGWLAIFGGVQILLLDHFKPEVIPGYSGTLMAPQGPVLLSSDVAPRVLEIGDGGATLSYQGPAGGSLFKFFGESNLTIESVDGKLKVSTDIRDPNGDLVAELVRNEWKVATPPRIFDRNYTKDALEVRNPQGRITLQVRLVRDRIKIQGEWWGTNGRGVRLVGAPGKGGMIMHLRTGQDLSKNPIRPMFKYPSEKYFGQLVGR